MRAGEYIPGHWLRPRPGRRIAPINPSVLEMATGLKAEKTVKKSASELAREGAPQDLLDKLFRRGPETAELATVTPADIKRSFKNAKGV